MYKSEFKYKAHVKVVVFQEIRLSVKAESKDDADVMVINAIKNEPLSMDSLSDIEITDVNTLYGTEVMAKGGTTKLLFDSNGYDTVIYSNKDDDKLMTIIGANATTKSGGVTILFETEENTWLGDKVVMVDRGIVFAISNISAVNNKSVVEAASHDVPRGTDLRSLVGMKVKLLRL